MQFHCTAYLPTWLEARDYRTTIAGALDALARADALGFDGIGFADPPDALGIGAAGPWALAGVLAQRTRHARINIVARTDTGVTPRAIAEEFASLDNLSGGRIRAGFRSASGSNCHLLGFSPALAFERFAETCDLVRRCWTETRPFHHDGACHRTRYVNIFPRAHQRPYPPIQIHSDGHGPDAQWAASRGFGYCVEAPYAQAQRQIRIYAQSAAPEHAAWMVPVHVDEDDAGARDGAAASLAPLIDGRNARPLALTHPPGLLASETAKLFLVPNRVSDIASLIERGHALVGSPATIIRRILQADADTGLGELHAVFHFGSLGEDRVARSIFLFAREVMAPLRQRFSSAKRDQRTLNSADAFG